MALIDKASLLMVPSTYEDGTLYNVLPSGNKAPDETGSHNGYDQTRADFTFSRGSNLAATRVNADGLIEKGRENLLLQSNQFDTTWGNNSSSETSGQADKDGGTDAWLLNSTGSFGSITQSFTAINGVSTLSIYAKAGTNNWLLLRMNATSDARAWFDLENGVLGSTDGPTIESEIEAIGTDGWYRCSITGNTSSFSQVLIYPTNANLVVGAAGSIYIQSAQLEYGLTASSYLDSGATTATAGVLENTPRIDYSSGAGALLLEPQRTNLLANSEYISSGDYVLDFVTSSNNQAISPEGVQNAALISGDGSSADHALYDLQNLSVGTYTLSAFVKKNTQRYIFLAFNQLNVATYWSSSVFDLDTLAKADYSSGTYSNGTSKIEDYGNGWYRISLTASIPSATDIIPFVGLASSTSAPNTSRGRYAFTTIDSFYLYGFQCEAGSHVSSYVPTYGSAATRGADSCSVTGASDVIGQSEGTLYVEFEYSNDSVGVVSIHSGNIGNRVYIGTDSNGLISQVRVGYVQQAFFSTPLTIGTTYKCAIAYKANDFALYVNGTQIGTDTSGSVPSSMIKFGFESGAGGDVLNQPTKQTILFNERLSNTELATLTTL